MSDLMTSVSRGSNADDPVGSSVIHRDPSALRRIRNAVVARQEAIRSTAQGRLLWRIAVTLIGTVVLLGGIVAIPFPGPGWLIVFFGIGILASEYTWAQRLLSFAKGHYSRWANWLSHQNIFIKALVGALTCAFVLIILWAIGTFSAVGNWFGVRHPWLRGLF